MGSALYQSTGSLHSDGHSSNSMSPAPSPSPTHALAQNTVKASKKIVSQAHYGPKSTLPTRPLSGSLSNLNLSTSRKWNSTNDFKDQGPLSNIRYLFISTIEKISLRRMVLVKFTDGNKRVRCILSDLRLDLNKTSTSLQTIDTGEHFQNLDLFPLVRM